MTEITETCRRCKNYLDDREWCCEIQFTVSSDRVSCEKYEPRQRFQHLTTPSVEGIATLIPENATAGDESMTETRVSVRVSDIGHWYKTKMSEAELGPFSYEDQQQLDFNTKLAAQLGVTPQELKHNSLTVKERSV